MSKARAIRIFPDAQLIGKKPHIFKKISKLMPPAWARPGHFRISTFQCHTGRDLAPESRHILHTEGPDTTIWRRRHGGQRLQLMLC